MKFGMETCALVFMVKVGVIYAVSIRIVMGQRYKEVERWLGFLFLGILIGLLGI